MRNWLARLARKSICSRQGQVFFFWPAFQDNAAAHQDRARTIQRQGRFPAWNANVPFEMAHFCNAAKMRKNQAPRFHGRIAVVAQAHVNQRAQALLPAVVRPDFLHIVQQKSLMCTLRRFLAGFLHGGKHFGRKMRRHCEIRHGWRLPGDRAICELPTGESFCQPRSARKAQGWHKSQPSAQRAVLAARLAASKAKEFFWLNTKSAKRIAPVSSGSSRRRGRQFRNFRHFAVVRPLV